ncbi:sushi, von Willebrand factor type A, EGF and pentraxin domain-containing protein 1 isoform X2 [Lingula anatina]|uniref:Sushi, von Willebrand factor type A, EGF and pentraxin domain-containing protein 1 isoform X2 n=1 Tax=Lingula anatina TaxID=7574 RepID=A0A1S3IGC2_LINAN|nr:sushi, von Willebrand factor type A, EGF and pentraxin domain-containing protein 1 isoform X2 [Lingula anatina]|eukprot:XP_013396519.1 sushi, von Willebrand factor type A, EGF and pentraxin domain-containing protein 1 isoform X2 [Lingula anatina]
MDRTLVVWFICALIGGASATLDSVERSAPHEEAMARFLVARQAKAFLHTRPVYRKRVKRGWFDRGEEAVERYRESLESDREQHQALVEIKCRQQWPWSEWSPCSGPCDSGKRSRSRTLKADATADCKKLPPPPDRFQQQVCYINCRKRGVGNGDKCICYRGYIGQCCEEAITCPRPAKPQYGHIEGVVVWPATYNSHLSYVCGKGYRLEGDRHRTCQLDGKWSGRDPEPCQRLECPNVTAPDHGILVNSKDMYLYGDTLGFQCDTGYLLHGPDSMTCVQDVKKRGMWSAVKPTCQARYCGNPGIPNNGARSGHVYTYDALLTFTCNHGYKLIGSTSRKCLPTGSWSGKQPICKEINCDQLEAPANGNIARTNERNGVGTKLVFSCASGYELVGNSTIECLADGGWTGQVPECEAITCSNPGNPEFGIRIDDGFLYRQNISFKCLDGYVLRGQQGAVCRANRQWSAPVPRCLACPKDTYKTVDQGQELCIPCPPNSHTVTNATGSRQLCMCNEGFIGPNGGPCQEIRCKAHSAPVNGSVVSCGTRVGETCVFACDEGHVLVNGSSVRRCTETGSEQGSWDGTEPLCLACPINTYKASIASCLPCPTLTHTNSTGNTLQGCMCDAGYKGPPGGPCTDENECNSNEGKGPCQQVCENAPGSYRCACSIQGYALDVDKHTCKVEKQCKNLTQSEAPKHGGLVCHWYHEENSQQCTLKCNPGYDFPSRINAFETCGPTTGFQWSFRRVDPTARLRPCIEEFFPGFRLEADTAYFTKQCKLLTEDDKEIVRRQFADALSKEGVCRARRMKVCDMRNIGIICGGVKRRRKRGTGETEELDQVDIAFILEAEKFNSTTDCDKICRRLRIPTYICDTRCSSVYHRFLRAALIYAKRTLYRLYSEQRNKVAFVAANRTFEAKERGAKVSNVIAQCEEGMKADDQSNCVPCPEGTFFNKTENACTDCPAGSYQPFTKQTICLPCPVGMTSQPGAAICSECPDKRYGENCAEICNCDRGKCDVISGQCYCDSGYEGLACDTDIPGCREAPCYPGVTCQDIPAPGTGYTCGSCPNGLTGDGKECYPISKDEL